MLSASRAYIGDLGLYTFERTHSRGNEMGYTGEDGPDDQGNNKKSAYAQKGRRALKKPNHQREGKLFQRTLLKGATAAMTRGCDTRH